MELSILGRRQMDTHYLLRVEPPQSRNARAAAKRRGQDVERRGDASDTAWLMVVLRLKQTTPCGKWPNELLYVDVH